MGGSQSIQLPPRVVEDPYPTTTGLTNLTLSPATTVACGNCDIGIDARASTASVKLTRDYGDISSVECKKYQADLDAVSKKEMSFHDFITNLQAGNYSRPVSETDKGAFCEQVMFSETDAKDIKSLEDFNNNQAKLKTVRIRKVTGGGSFSSGTKAKFKLSLPIKAKYVSEIQQGQVAENKMVNTPPPWHWITDTSTVGQSAGTPVFKDITISMLTMYHPSPLRIENVQHDAVLSLNDPSDPTADTVILIPLKASNMGDESVDFFTKIAKHLTTIAAPDSVTGLYPETEIPTGNDWNIKKVFWLDSTPSADNISKVTDAFYTWTGAGNYTRVQISSSVNRTGPFSFNEIRYGWKPDGAQVRYFMLATPVSISTTDLSFLTRSLPQTPAEEAIHKIPDPTSPNNLKVLYKKATGPGASAGCGVGRERMTNQSKGDAISSLFAGTGVEELLVDEKGRPITDMDSCDPFKTNAKNVMARASLFTPAKLTRIFFNVLSVLAIAFGSWLALYLILNKDYDKKFRDFASDTGKVVAAFMLVFQGTKAATKSAEGESQEEGGVEIPGGLEKLATKFGK